MGIVVLVIVVYLIFYIIIKRRFTRLAILFLEIDPFDLAKAVATGPEYTKALLREKLIQRIILLCYRGERLAQTLNEERGYNLVSAFMFMRIGASNIERMVFMDLFKGVYHALRHVARREQNEKWNEFFYEWEKLRNTVETLKYSIS